MTLLTIQVFFFILFLVFVNLLTGFKRKNSLFCGLVGFSGTKPFDLKLIKILLWHNSLTRGEDATGLFSPSNGVKKGVKKAKDFFNEPEFKDFTLNKKDDNVLLGHVRKATVGNKDNPDSAHPWDFGDIVMMHNGTLEKSNYESLASKYNIKDYSVDSQVLGYAIQDNFRTGEPFKVLTEYVGAAATIVYHKEKDSMFVYRDNERTLYRGYLNETELYISSIPEVLELMGCEDVELFEPYKVYQYKEGKLINCFTIKRNRVRNVKNIIRLVVDDIKDVLFYKDYNNIKRTFINSIYSGFSKLITTGHLLDGYWLQATAGVTGTSVNSAKITKGNFYRVTRIDPDDPRKVYVADDSGTSKSVHIYIFNTEAFIPSTGDYVVVESLPHNNRNRLKLKELYEVISHNYGDPNIIIRDHNTNTNIKESVFNTRLATEAEIKKYFKDISIKVIMNETAEESSNSCNLPSKNTPVISLNKAKKTEDIIDITDAIIVDDDDNNEGTEESISINEILITQYSAAFKVLEENLSIVIEDFNKEDSKINFDRLKILATFVKRCADEKNNYILNVNENSILNLDYAEC